MSELLVDTISKDLIKKIKDIAFLKGEFTTRAGKKTDYYIDKYLFETTPEILDEVTDAIVSCMPDAETYDRIAAPEVGAVSLAAVVSIKVNKPFVIIRKENKGYGTSQLIEGNYKSGESMVMLEDVLTTGGAAIRAANILVENKVTINKIIGVIDREEGAIQNIKDLGWEAIGLIKASDLKAVQ